MESEKLVDTGIRVFNSLGQTKQPLMRPEGLPLRCYTCGPTVYSTSHLGHARTYISLDMVRRIMTDYFNIPVQWSMNVTDIDDKIIDTFNKMNDADKAKYGSALGYSADREKAFFAELDTLNVRRPDSVLRVSEVMPEIIDFVDNLVQQGFAYESEGSVYFDVEKYEHDVRFVYAELERSSYTSTAENENPAESGEKKRNRNDFALWKKAKPFEEAAGQYWETKWGKGRPGWHIECSTMSGLFYGKQFDVHCGGIDLRFPHHTNEIAQSQTRWGATPWVRTWLHTGQLRAADGEKMSKSMGNFWSIADGLKKYDVNLIRMIFCLVQWQNVMQLGDDLIEHARVKLTRIMNFLQTVEAALHKSISELKHGFKPHDHEFAVLISVTSQKIHDAFADNFDIPTAIDAMIELIDAYYQKKDLVIDSLVISAARLVHNIMAVLGFAPETVLLSQASTDFAKAGFPQAMCQYRQNVRKNNLDMLKQVRELAKALNIDLKKDTGAAADLLKQLETGVKTNMAQLDTMRDDSLLSIGIKLEDNAEGNVDFKLGDPKQFMEAKKSKQTTQTFKNKPQQPAESKKKGPQMPKPIKDGIPMHPDEYYRSLTDFYSEWDEQNIPTKDAKGEPLSKNQYKKLKQEYQRILTAYNTYHDAQKQ